MKTLTEFPTIVLKSALAKKQELAASGKTAEELPAAMGEALKLEGDKLTFLLAALEVMGEKTNDLKRVVVSALNEGETAPSSARLIGEKYFSVEYYPATHKTGHDHHAGGGDDRGSRGGRGGGRDGKGKGGKPGERGGRGPGGPGGPGRGDGRSAGGPGGDRGGAAGPRGPKPAHVSTGRLPVANKVGGGAPVANKTADESGTEKT